MKKVVSLILALVLCLSLCACGGSKETTPAADAGYTYSGPRLTIGGADSTGTMYAAAVQVAATFTNNINGMNVDATTSTGSNENAKKVNSGEIQLGMCSGDAGYNATHGLGKFADGKIEDIVCIGCVYSSVVSLIALKSSGWTYLHDVKGSKGTIGIGPAASTTEVSTKVGLQVAGLEEEGHRLGDGVVRDARQGVMVDVVQVGDLLDVVPKLVHGDVVALVVHAGGADAGAQAGGLGTAHAFPCVARPARPLDHDVVGQELRLRGVKAQVAQHPGHIGAEGRGVGIPPPRLGRQLIFRNGRTALEAVVPDVVGTQRAPKPLRDQRPYLAHLL